MVVKKNVSKKKKPSDSAIKKKIRLAKKEMREIAEKLNIEFTEKQLKREMVMVKKTGVVVRRCMSKKRGTNPEIQCHRHAKKGDIYCNRHTPPRRKWIREAKEKYGLYNVKKSGKLKEHLEAVERVPEEQLTGLKEEIKLSLATLRGYLEETTDLEILRKPGRLMWILDGISRLKRNHHEILHGPKVTFTVDQVQYLFIKLRVVITNNVKDMSILKKISDEMNIIGLEMKEDGWKIK